MSATIVPALLVHGGAGAWQQRDHGPSVAACERAAEVGLRILAGGGSALEAVVAAVRVLEDAPVLNAGIGSSLNRLGEVEVDASLMEGTSLRFGAVAAVPDGYPGIELARAVLDDGEHALLSGAAVWELARERGLAPPPPPGHLITEARRRMLDEVARRRAGGRPTAPDPGTVGAVAVDAAGRVVAGTSTGGTTYKRVGRIGDTPLAGCGTYADDRGGAASATGHGEDIIRITMTRTCVDRMRDGASAADAAWAAVDALADVSGSAGVICCDRHGRLGAAHNTEGMPWAGGRVGKTVRAALVSERGDIDLGTGALP